VIGPEGGAWSEGAAGVDVLVMSSSLGFTGKFLKKVLSNPFPLILFHPVLLLSPVLPNCGALLVNPSTNFFDASPFDRLSRKANLPNF
jgi:hypothetical protein